jgi:hypothetical protein
MSSENDLGYATSAMTAMSHNAVATYLKSFRHCLSVPRPCPATRILVYLASRGGYPTFRFAPGLPLASYRWAAL